MMMSDAEEVRAMEIATKLVLGPLSGVDTIAIKAAGCAIVDILDEIVAEETIRAVGELLESLTERCREAIARGERWGKRSRALSQEDGQKVLRGMTLDQLDAFATRLGYGRDEVISGAMGYSEIHAGVLWALGDQDEMAKITGETR
jgi:hypothetical protein